MHAQYVCHACNARKKACDKKLPACGFCSARNLDCEYDEKTSKKKGFLRKYNPGRKFVTIPPRQSTDPPGQWLLLPTTTQSVDELVHTHALCLIGSMESPSQGPSELYFRTFHQWYPIISPEAFQHVESSCCRRNCIPPADFSILLLSMCMITSLPNQKQPFLLSSYFNCGVVYTTTKSLFALVQATRCKSVRLTQAGFLIAACEYTCAHPETAYISLNTCLALMDFQGSQTQFSNTCAVERGTNGVRSISTDESNMVKAVATLERMILLEVDPSRVARTKFLDCSEQFSHRQQRLARNPALDTLPLSTYLGHFYLTEAREKTVCALDQVLHIIQLTTANEERKSFAEIILELTNTDTEIRYLLGVLMGESYEKNVDLCTPVALCIRSLFLLHKHVIDLLLTCPSEYSDQVADISRAALSTACEMVVDAVQFPNNYQSGMMPICCYYNLRTAIEFLVEQKGTSAEIDILRQAERAYRSKCLF
ncbi:hypothetical protein BGW36DRAFT_298399 [Talaromyces proteolyticus]|uniref:Zn(2)-C6 fungal-type domain-containing protein n=1 Tax=Talaromyces proteolyticus TaxID=1131652 RepID=A0AAD4KQ90_9EURO|nr:uncharacterized protein BGW36DRAFT_298399 [Talaromyces proteolyticus]KAH8696745.1 hypothetical protein BGW36DRAFT_298399 [Talaromyces proteolyticus]